MESGNTTSYHMKFQSQISQLEGNLQAKQAQIDLLNSKLMELQHAHDQFVYQQKEKNTKIGENEVNIGIIFKSVDWIKNEITKLWCENNSQSN